MIFTGSSLISDSELHRIDHLWNLKKNQVQRLFVFPLSAREMIALTLHLLVDGCIIGYLTEK